MPIKEISKEEKANLYLPRQPKRETLQLTEVERGNNVRYKTLMMIFFPLANFNTNLPLSFYNRLAARLGPIEEPHSYGSAGGAFFNPDIVNPNSHNRHFGWPISVRSNLDKDEQVATFFNSMFIKSLSPVTIGNN